jgi:hypothetical protein
MWHGWAWTGGKWRRCCQAPGLERCARELSRHARRLKVPDRLTCLTGGGCPAWTPKEKATP